MRITEMRMARAGSMYALALAVIGAGCGGKSTTAPCSPGAERCDCRLDTTCNDGLVCASNVCVRIGGTDTGLGGAGGSGATGNGGAGGVVYTGAGGSRIPPDAGLAWAHQVD